MSGKQLLILGTPKATTSWQHDAATEPVVDLPRPQSSVRSLVSGAFGGVCCLLVGYPLDMVKVRMQMTGASSMSKIGKDILRRDGVFGFYRGVWAPIVGVQPISSTCYWGFTTGKRLVRQAWGLPQTADLNAWQLGLASSVSSVCMSVFTTPTDRVKVLMQSQAGKGAQRATLVYTSSWDCATHLVRSGGLPNLYRGWFATLARDIPGYCAYFITYDVAKRSIMRMQGLDPHSKEEALSPLAIITAGGLGGMALWLVAMPLDTLKSKYQASDMESSYNGIGDVYRKLMQKEGIGALYRGVRPALLRAFPANAAFFMGAEAANKALSFLDDEPSRR